MWKVDKNNFSDLSFVVKCLFNKAISNKELQLWVEQVIGDADFDDIPMYMFELITFDEAPPKLIQLIGFSPYDNLNINENHAILGITFLRGIDIYDPKISKEDAIKLLRDNPHIYEKYKHFFPFIKLPELNADISV